MKQLSFQGKICVYFLIHKVGSTRIISINYTILDLIEKLLIRFGKFICIAEVYARGGKGEGKNINLYFSNVKLKSNTISFKIIY